MGKKVVMVTGALGGIGREVTSLLLKNGFCVAGSYADGVETEDDAKLFAASLGDSFSCYPLNLGDRHSVKKFFESTLKHWTRIDSLVNNAGVGSATVANYSHEQDEQNQLLLSMNASGTLQLTLLFIEHLTLQWQTKNMNDVIASKLINISSVGGGIAAFPNFNLADGMSKAAIAFMTRQLAAAHVHTPLDVFAVCPGATDTPMFQTSTLNKLTPAERKTFINRLPKSSVIKPTEIAELVLFLLGEKSRVLHGAVLDASMGLGSRPGLMTEWS